MKPYPISPPKVLRTQAIIDQLLAEDIIERSTSDYSSPSFLVTSNSKDRLVVNYAKLNNCLESTAYPIGDLHDCIHFLTGAKVFSTIDLSNSFYQIELTPESRKYTAFSTGYSLYNFKRIPYGLKVGSGILSKVMDDIFSDLKFKQCINFIDDLILYSEDLPSHMKLLETVFERLKQNGLTVNPKKVKLACKEISFLGNIVSHNTCRIDPSRVEKVLNYPKPRNVKELATFIGMASYFSKHIEGYASKAACLNELRKKRSKFIWTKECEDSFNQLRLDLANPPILRLADFSKRFKLQTDASNKAVGACLLQEDEEGTYLPIAYYSRKFTPAEYMCNVYEKECMSIIYASERFHKFLEVKPYILETDNMALAWILRRGDKFGKLARWIHRILALPFTIVHIKGQSNVLADAMSRMYSQDEIVMPKIEFVEVDGEQSPDLEELSKGWGSPNIDSNVNNEIVEKVELAPKVVSKSPVKVSKECVNIIHDCPLAFVEISKLQMSDPEIVQIVQSVNNKSCKNNYHVKNNVLMYKKNDQCKAKIYVSAEMVNVLFEYYHNSGSTGWHYGQFKTMQRICNLFYRPGLANTIRKLVNKCEKCKLGKPTNKRYWGNLRSQPTTQVWEKCHCDLIGPLVRSNNYTQVLILVDDLSKFCHLVPMINATSQTVINKIQDVIIKQHGVFRTLTTDNGSCFRSVEFKNFMFKLGVEHHRIPPHAQFLNPAERYVQTMKHRLKIYFNEKQNQWSKELSFLQLSLNASINQSTMSSAHSLMYTYPNMDPLLNKWHVNELLDLKCNNKDEIKCKLDEAIVNIRKSICKNKRRYKYSEVFSKIPFKVGDIVYLENHPQSSKIKNVQAGMENKYVGPFKLLMIENMVSCIILNTKNELDCRRCHVSQLKKG